MIGPRPSVTSWLPATVLLWSHSLGAKRGWLDLETYSLLSPNSSCSLWQFPLSSVPRVLEVTVGRGNKIGASAVLSPAPQRHSSLWNVLAIQFN